VIGVDTVIFEDFLHCDADRCATAPHGDQEGGPQAAAYDHSGELHGVVQQGVGRYEEFFHGL